MIKEKKAFDRRRNTIKGKKIHADAKRHKKKCIISMQYVHAPLLISGMPVTEQMQCMQTKINNTGSIRNQINSRKPILPYLFCRSKKYASAAQKRHYKNTKAKKKKNAGTYVV